jgi:hypothetical protein
MEVPAVLRRMISESECESERIKLWRKSIDQHTELLASLNVALPPML